MSEKKKAPEAEELADQELEAVDGGLAAPFDLGLTGIGPSGVRSLRDRRAGGRFLKNKPPKVRK